MKYLSLFSFSQDLSPGSRVLFYAQKKNKVPTYLQSNDLKLDRFKDIVLSYIPGFNKKSLQFVVNYLKELGEKIRVVLVRSPGGPNRHCMLFGKSKDPAKDGSDLYFRVGITPSSGKHPKGRIYVESVESGEKRDFEPDDTKAFEQAMKLFCKEVITEKTRIKSKSETKGTTISSSIILPETRDPCSCLKKIKKRLESFLGKIKHSGMDFVHFFHDLLVKAKAQFKNDQKTI